MEEFEKLFTEHMLSICEQHPDPSHDILHVKRTVSIAKRIAVQENANLNVVIPASYLHDCVYISKTDDRRTQASRISADKAIELLEGWSYSSDYFPAIHHAIAAHSFSSGIKAETLEAQVVQDADRLDAMGAVGIFRCFAFSGISKRPFYHSDDPFCKTRQPNDQTNTLDHFFTKLLHLQKRLNTATAKIEGERRVNTMKAFLNSLEYEIDSSTPSSKF